MGDFALVSAAVASVGVAYFLCLAWAEYRRPNVPITLADHRADDYDDREHA